MKYFCFCLTVLSEISYKKQSVWGVGIHQNTVIAGLESVINGLNRLSI